MDTSAGSQATAPRYRDQRDDKRRRDNRGDRHDMVARIDRTCDQIDRAENSPELNLHNSRSLRKDLQDISCRQARLRHRDGWLYPADEANINGQIEAVEQAIWRFSRR